MSQQYEVFAIRYATMSPRTPHMNYLSPDPHETTAADLDYFVWLIRGGGRDILVDTGFNEAAAKERSRKLTVNPVDALAAFGVHADTIRDVVVTHLHYDHAGNLDRFPNARFHLQDKEMQYVTGRHMRHNIFRRPYEIDHVAGMIRLVFKNRVVFYNGEGEVASGISVHHIGGHTMGLQSVRVHTQRGWVMLASDASHYYEHFEQNRCFPLVYHLGEMIEGFATLHRLADSPQHIVPGHDPLVLQRYPAVTPELKGIAARLDVAPHK